MEVAALAACPGKKVFKRLREGGCLRSVRPKKPCSAGHARPHLHSILQRLQDNAATFGQFQQLSLRLCRNLTLQPKAELNFCEPCGSRAIDTESPAEVHAA